MCLPGRSLLPETGDGRSFFPGVSGEGNPAHNAKELRIPEVQCTLPPEVMYLLSEAHQTLERGSVLTTKGSLPSQTVVRVLNPFPGPSEHFLVKIQF